MSVYLWRLLNQLRDINAENKVTLPRLTILRRMLEAVASLISAVRLQFVWKVFVSYFLFCIFRFVCRHVWTVFIYLYVRTIFHVNSEEIMLDYRSVGEPNAHLRKLLIRLVFDLKNKTNNDRYCCWPLSIVSCVCDTIISIHGVDSFLVN